MNPTQTAYSAIDAGSSQEHRLAAYLRARPNQWVAMPELATVITETGLGTAVHSRVAGARKRFGITIDQRGGSKSEYRFVPQPVNLELEFA